jgi:MFS transporter, DHA1 family, multidrug resistance protein
MFTQNFDRETMYDIFRDSAVGQWLRFLGAKQLVPYPEESPSFELPEAYLSEKPSLTDDTQSDMFAAVRGLEEGRASLEISSDAETKTQSTETLSDRDITVVSWYSDDDPDNPHNWSFMKKMWVSALLLLYTTSVYIGASVYTASEPGIVTIFGVSTTAAALGLSLYVIAYGIGPLLFAPLSEIPAIGRNPPYIYTYIIFVGLCVGAVLVENFGGLLVLRFLLGFFGSPCLANAAASYGDFFGGREMPYVIALWGGGATLSPVHHLSLQNARRPLH